MMIVDRCYFQQQEARTEEEFEAEVREQFQKRLKKVLRSISNYQVKKERAVKLQSMVSYLYGKFLLRIPRVSVNLYSDIPLPQSRAEPRMTTEPIQVVERKFGQALEGDMIPVRDIQAKNSTSSNVPSTHRVGEHERLLGADGDVSERASAVADERSTKTTNCGAPSRNRVGEGTPLLLGADGNMSKRSSAAADERPTKSTNSNVSSLNRTGEDAKLR